MKGTSGFIPPEIFNNSLILSKDYNGKKRDVYALGIILFNLISKGNFPNYDYECLIRYKNSF